MRVPLLFPLATIALGAALVSCGDSEEVIPGPSSAPATTAASTTASPTPDLADWPTYADPDGRFTMRYPASWFMSDDSSSTVKPKGYLVAIFTSFAPGSGAGQFPSQGAKVDLEVFMPSTGNDCRQAPEGTTPDTLGGAAGWRRFVPVTEGDGRSKSVGGYFDQYCYVLTGYFGSKNTNDEIFETMIRTFAFSTPTG